MKMSSLVAGRPVRGDEFLEVHNPYDGSRVGSVRLATRNDVDGAVTAAGKFTQTLTRFERAEILEKPVWHWKPSERNLRVS